MLDFTAAEAKRDLYLVAARKKTAGVILLGFHIVFFDADTELNLFDRDDLLILPRFLFPLGLLEAVLAVIHNLADGRICLRRDLNQVKTFVVSNLLRVTGRLDAELGTVGIDQANLGISDLFVELKFLCADGKTPP